MTIDRIYVNGRRFNTEGAPYYTIIARTDGYQVVWHCPCCGDLFSRERFPERKDALTAIGLKLGRTENGVYSQASKQGTSLAPTNQSPYNRGKG